MIQRAPTARTSLQIDVLGAAAIVAVSVLVWTFGVSPHREQRAARLMQLDELRNQKRLAQQANGGVFLLKRQLAQVQQRLDAGAITLGSIEQLNRRLDELTALINQCQMQINTIQSGRPTREDCYDTVEIQIEGMGSYPHFAAFIQRLYQACDDVAVGSFELTGTGVHGATASFRMELILYVASSSDALLSSAQAQAR